jgi:predicted acylesterase/phospholipase RssA
MSRELRKTRRALVIAGGGAKGAYAFGCMKAFCERKITFDSVAGASAGALNALIWSADCFVEGERLWTSMSFETVYPFKMLDPSRFSLATRRIVGLAYFLSRLIWSAVIGISTPFRRMWIAIFALAASLTVSQILRAYFPLNGRWPQLLCLIGVAITIFVFLSTKRRTDRIHVFRWLGLGFNIPLANWLAFCHFSTGSILIMMLLLNLAVCVGLWRLFRDDMSVLSQSGLAKSLQEILAHPLIVPVTVALSRQADINDPDSPRWYFDVTPPGPGSTAFPDTQRVWTTDYIRIDLVERDKALQISLASAALPFGIVPPVLIDDKVCVDGGLTDNVPVFPFVDNPDFDEVFVILLQPVKSPEAMVSKIGFDRHNWSLRDRAARVANYPLTHHVLGLSTFRSSPNRPPIVIPFRFPSLMPRARLFHPNRSLGTFLSGTLNFNGRYAETLIRDGYEDTIAALGPA